MLPRADLLQDRASHLRLAGVVLARVVVGAVVHHRPRQAVVGEQLRSGQSALLGLLLESNLEAGRQPWEPGARLRRGVSITDACIGWDETETLLHEIAAALRGPRRTLSRAPSRTGNFVRQGGTGTP